MVGVLLDEASVHYMKRQVAKQVKLKKAGFDRGLMERSKRDTLVRLLVESLVHAGRSVVLLHDRTRKNHTITPPTRKAMQASLASQALSMSLSLALDSDNVESLPLSPEDIVDLLRRVSHKLFEIRQ